MSDSNNMTDENQKKNAREEDHREAGADGLAGAAEAALGAEGTDGEGEPVADNAEALAILVEGLKGENADLKDKYLRLAAEMDNLRRRTERDLRDAKSYSVASFARDMLTVSDNLQRALEAVKPEQRAAEAGLGALVEGVEMTDRTMLATLEKHGVRKLESEGQKFDPHFHQAMFEVPNTDVPNNTVVQVVQEGYVIGERVLRPAMVGVSKGGPKQPVEPVDAGPDTPDPQAENDA